VVSRSFHSQELLRALTAAGVKVDLRVESQANPNLLVGIAQGALQADVTAGQPQAGYKGLNVRFGTDNALTATLAIGSETNVDADNDVTFIPGHLTAHDLGGSVLSLNTTLRGSQNTIAAQEATSNELQVVQHVGTTGIDPRKVDPGLADSSVGGGSFTSPGAAQNLVSLTPGVAGKYQVLMSAGVQGTVTVNDEDNILFYIDANFQFRLPNTTGSVNQFGPFRITLTATNALKLNTSVAGTVGAKYLIGLIATRTG